MEFGEKKKLRILGIVHDAALILFIVVFALTTYSLMEPLNKSEPAGEAWLMPVVSRPEQVVPISVDENGIEEYDYFEITLYDARTDLADACAMYNTWASTGEGLTLLVGTNDIRVAMNYDDTLLALQSASASLDAAEALLPTLKQKDPLPRAEAMAFLDMVIYAERETEIVLAGAEAGAAACDAAEKMHAENRRRLVANCILLILSAVVALTTVITKDRIAKMALKKVIRRSSANPVITYPGRENKDGTPKTE